MAKMNFAVIAALSVAIAVLGYLYYMQTQNDVTVRIDVPGVEVQAN